MTRMRHILCASDFSKTSGRALNAAIHLAKNQPCCASGTILHGPCLLIGAAARWSSNIEARPWDSVDTETRRWAERQAERPAEKARKLGVFASGLMVDW